MTHPISGGEYDADPLQVPHLEEAGWQVADGEDDSAVERWPADLRRFDGQAKVRMRHPQIDADPITVAESAVPFHREKGWQVIDEEAEAAAAANPEHKTLQQLKDQLRELNKTRPDNDQLPVSGTKAELLERVRDAQNEAGVEPAQPTEEDEG